MKTSIHEQNILSTINALKKWSNMSEYEILFDSDLHGDGIETLRETVLNKQNLYFISFDEKSNVYGGFVKVVIDKTDRLIPDPNAFLFSLIRNGETSISKHPIKKSDIGYAFELDRKSDYLYSFGMRSIFCYGGADISVWSIGTSNSSCWNLGFEFNENEELVDNSGFDHLFCLNRIVVVEMN
ncbi:TLDc domain-containing protein [Entamoeba marina]